MNVNKDKIGKGKRIAIAGAFGFIGRFLLDHLVEHTDYEIIAISRSTKKTEHPRIISVAADLYSPKEAKNALNGCHTAIYLVHSMAPGSRLSQGSFQDFDFILADNFARAARDCHVEHVIYVGGMIPNRVGLSPHLKSRLEVEDVLKSYGIAVSAIRCGLVIGHKASSFSIIVRLTQRLPVMILPQWMRTLSNPIYVEDLASLIVACVNDPMKEHRVIDAGMDQSVSYKDMIVTTAKQLEESPKLIDVPYVSPKLSKLWVRLVSGSPRALVYPLIDSVRHEMLKSPHHPIPTHWQVKLCDLEEAIEHTFEKPFIFTKPRMKKAIRDLKEVRSIQRMHLPDEKDAAWVADHYIRWLPPYLKPFLKLKSKGQKSSYYLRGLNIELLGLEKDLKVSKSDRQLYRVTSGVLVSGGSNCRFEFRESPDRSFLVVALHNYRPSLPWPIYRFTQSVIHRIVMDHFGKLLKSSSL